MSAFVVDTETMDKVVRVICGKGRYGQIISKFRGIYTDEGDPEVTIGRMLFTLNIEAVMQRYPDCVDKPEELPGEDGCASFPDTYKPRHISYAPLSREEMIGGYKALRCLIYQCSEGDVPESKTLVALEEASNVIAHELVSSLPEYEAAPWG